MRRRKHLLVIFCLSCFLVSPAFGFSTHNTTISRTFDKVEAVVDGSIAVTVNFKNLEPNDLKGFYYTEHIPEGLTVNTNSVTVNGTLVPPENYTVESGSGGDVYPGYASYRWVLETPTDFDENNPIPPNYTVEIVYSVTSHQEGTFEFNEFSWVGYYQDADQGEREAFGHSGLDDIVTLSWMEESPTLISLSITGPTFVDENSIANYTATATFSTGDSQLATNRAVWSVLPSLYASFSSPGELTTLAVPSDQTVTITAEYTFGDVTKAGTMDVTIVNESGTDDSDDDGMPDTWEIAHFGDLSHDGTADSDSDGLTDLEEFQNETNPNNRDTDGDGLPDGWEVDYDLDPNDPNDASYDSDDDGYTNLEEYKGDTSPNYASSHPTRPYVIETDCHPYDGQGIEEDSLRVPIDTSVVVRIQDDEQIEEASVVMTVGGAGVTPVLKQVTEGDPSDYWVIYHPPAVFGFEEMVAVTIDAEDNDGIAMEIYSYSFEIESLAEHDDAQANTPASTEDCSDLNQCVCTADPGTEIEGAKILYDPAEPVTPRFGPLGEIPGLTASDGVGLPVALEPPTVFENPVTVYIPCPGVDDVSTLDVYYYNPNPAVGWLKAEDADGWMESRINHNGTSPPTIEIQVNHFSGVQAAGSGSSGGSTGGGDGGGGGGGCFICTTAYRSAEQCDVNRLYNFFSQLWRQYQER